MRPADTVWAGHKIRWQTPGAIHEGIVWSSAPGGGYWVTENGRYVAVRRNVRVAGGWVEYQPEAAR